MYEILYGSYSSAVVMVTKCKVYALIIMHKVECELFVCL